MRMVGRLGWARAPMVRVDAEGAAAFVALQLARKRKRSSCALRPSRRFHLDIWATARVMGRWPAQFGCTAWDSALWVEFGARYATIACDVIMGRIFRPLSTCCWNLRSACAWVSEILA